MVVELSKDFEARYNKLIFSKLQYRNSRTGARSTRTQIDHDVFEGLPVRHWRKRSFNVSTAPEKDNLDLLGTGDTGWPELHMPRDAHMYSPMSKALLRAARMGQVKKPATPLMDDEKELGEDEDADGDLDMGFVAKRWAVLPKDMEGPEPEFLAKRRKGLPSVYTGATGPLGNTPQMRKTKIRKVDTEGNSYIWEVLVPDGQAVDGEIVEEETSPTQAPAPGTVVEGLGVVNAEGVVIAGDQAMPAANRRRPPPPKRKAKGPGRGRKKKVAFTPGTEGSVTANGAGAMLNGSSAGADDGKSAKTDHGVPDEDTEMGDENVLQEGEEGSEEGSEGEEGEDGDREEGELSPSPTPAKSPAEPPKIIVNDVKVEPAEIIDSASPSPSKGPLSSPAEPVRNYSSDPMLLDEDDDQPVNHSFSELAVSSIAQSTEPTTEVTGPVATDDSEETMPTAEFTPRISEAIVEVPSTASITESQAEAKPESTMTHPPDTASQFQLDTIEHSVTDKATDTVTEQPMESLVESLMRPGMAPMPDISAERIIEGMAVSAAEAAAQQILGAPADITEEAVPESRIDNLEGFMTDSMPASSTAAAPELTRNDMLTPSTNSMMGLKEEMRMELLSEPPTRSVMEPVEESEPVVMQLVDEQPSVELSIAERSVIVPPVIELPLPEQSMAEQPTEEHPTAEHPTTEHPTAEYPTAEHPTAEHPTAEHPTAEHPTLEHPTAEQPTAEQPTTERLTTEQTTTDQVEAQQPGTEQFMPEQTITEQQAETEPWTKPATEPFPESISPERRFSYTRVTTSPQAPTPSPPTPIENTFGLKAPYLSPKAPTMSPPTPIERSMSSSPDIPLADQHFRLPPQIDAAQEADQALASDVLLISEAERTSVPAVPNINTHVNAQIAVEHEALDVIAEPRVAKDPEGSPQHFTDGEEDLLGSLERSLGKHGARS